MIMTEADILAHLDQIAVSLQRGEDHAATITIRTADLRELLHGKVLMDISMSEFCQQEETMDDTAEKRGQHVPEDNQEQLLSQNLNATFKAALELERLERENAELKATIEQIGKENARLQEASKSQSKRITKLKGIIAGLEIQLATVRGYAERVVQEDLARVQKEMPPAPPLMGFDPDTYPGKVHFAPDPRPAFEVPYSRGGPAYKETVESGGLYGTDKVKREEWFEI